MTNHPLSTLFDTPSEKDPFNGNHEARIDTMRELQTLLEQKHTFKKGDIVTWKEGLHNRRTMREPH